VGNCGRSLRRSSRRSTHTVIMDSPLIVLFAYHYPPDNAIGAMRPARFVKYLSRLGYRCLIVTAAGQGQNGPPEAIHVPDRFATSTGAWLSSNLDRAVRKLLVPGALGTSWSLHAVNAARKALAAVSSPQITIISSFPPLGPHLAAWRMSRQTGFPWIADFRDPIVAPGLEELIHPFQLRFEQWLERRVLAAAEIVIANTDSAAAAWSQCQPALSGKIHTIWNGFDPENRVTALPIPLRSYKLLSHAGELYHGRTVAPLLKSIDRLVTSEQLAPRKIRVQLVGPAGEDSLPPPDVITRGRQAQWLELKTESIPQAEARQLTRSSDALLLVQPHTQVQVPGKLFEYLQIGRPILAFVLPGSPIERILERSGVPYRCVYPGTPPEAFDATVLSFFSLPSSAVQANSWFEQNFSAGEQTQVLHTLIQSLHSQRA
jgi:Glycosyltransferase Family 4